MKKILFFTLSIFAFSSFAHAASVPNFDTKNYCKQMASFGGGSAILEVACRDQEAEAAALIKLFEAPERAVNTCMEMAKFGGESYILYYECLKQEKASIKALEQ